MTPELSAIFNMEPKAAIAFLESKGYAITWDWQDMLDDAHQRAFTVAKVTQLDVLQDIRTALVKSVREGTTLRQFIKDLAPKLQAAGWWGKKVIVDSAGNAQVVQQGSPRRLETIFQTNMQSAYMAARMQEMQASTDTHPYWQYVAVLDGRTRPSHRALNGKVLPADDPFWITGFPPNGYNCRCRVKPMTGAALRRKGIEADSSAGRLKTITVESGVDPRTGEVRYAKRTGMTVMDESGKEVFFAPDAGFNAAPQGAAGLYDVLAQRATALLGEKRGTTLLQVKGIGRNSAVSVMAEFAQHLRLIQINQLRGG
jgi:SPP1 gp7 family putative phage head morphogenesis protein